MAQIPLPDIEKSGEDPYLNFINDLKKKQNHSK